MSSESPSEMSGRQSSGIAGLGYIIIFLLGFIANFFIFDKIFVSGDAIATWNNIIANELLFRVGITCWVVVIISDTIVAWALYTLLKNVNKNLALLSAWFRLIFVAIFANALINHFSILLLVGNAGYLRAFETNQLQAQVMSLLKSYENGVHVSFIFFGLHILVLGYLILKSDYIPRFIGIFLIIASCGYFIDSFGNFLYSDYSANKTLFLVFVAVPAIVSEMSLTIWLVYNSVKRRS